MGVAVPARVAPARGTRHPAGALPGFQCGNGYRLGYGGGYYDRTLAAAPRPRTLGIAYALPAGAISPAATHDVALDHVVTEGDLY